MTQVSDKDISKVHLHHQSSDFQIKKSEIAIKEEKNATKEKGVRNFLPPGCINVKHQKNIYTF